MEDAVHAVEKGLQRALGEVQLRDGETQLPTGLPEVGLLPRSGVVVGEGVDSDHFVPALQQRLREV